MVEQLIEFLEMNPLFVYGAVKACDNEGWFIETGNLSHPQIHDIVIRENIFQSLNESELRGTSEGVSQCCESVHESS